MRLAYYPGCSLHGTAREYDMSTRVVCRALGIDLVEIEDWNCCGATSAHSTNHVLSIALPARNLAQAAGTGLPVTIPCAACYQRMKLAQISLDENDEMRAAVETALGVTCPREVPVQCLLEVLSGCHEGIRERVVSQVGGLKAACYYGCLLLRPPSVSSFDDPEQPQSMDRLLEVAGAKPVDWPYKTECCGASLSLTNETIVLKLVRDILRTASDAGAECLVVACPLCHGNLDGRQGRVNQVFGTEFRLPVLYFTQVLGLALGADPKELGLDRHFVSTASLVKAIKERE